MVATYVGWKPEKAMACFRGAALDSLGRLVWMYTTVINSWSLESHIHSLQQKTVDQGLRTRPGLSIDTLPSRLLGLLHPTKELNIKPELQIWTVAVCRSQYTKGTKSPNTLLETDMETQ